MTRDVMDTKDKPQPGQNEAVPPVKEPTLEEVVAAAKAEEFYPSINAQDVAGNAESFFSSFLVRNVSRETDEVKRRKIRRDLLTVIDPHSAPQQIVAAALALNITSPSEIEHWLGVQSPHDAQKLREQQQKIEQVMEAYNPSAIILDAPNQPVERLLTAAKKTLMTRRQVEELAEKIAPSDPTKAAELRTKAAADTELLTDEEREAKRREDEEKNPIPDATQAQMNTDIADIQAQTTKLQEITQNIDALSAEQKAKAIADAEQAVAKWDKTWNSEEFNKRLAVKIPVYTFLTILVLMLLYLKLVTGSFGGGKR